MARVDLAYNELVWSLIRPQSDPPLPFLFLPKPQWSVQQGKSGHVLVELASATWWSPPKSCLPACRAE